MNASLLLLGSAACAFGLAAQYTGSVAAAGYGVVFSVVSGLAAAYDAAAGSSATTEVNT